MLTSLLFVQTSYAVPMPKITPISTSTPKPIKVLEIEQDELKSCLVNNEALTEQLNTIKVSRDMACQETNVVRKELEQIKNVMTENQGSIDTLLNDLQNTKKDLATALADKDSLVKTIEAINQKTKTKTQISTGDLVIITPNIIPARPINLNRVTPKIKDIRGVVVVNVLISENGEVLDTRLLQGLPGATETVSKANALCVEQAKRIIFDPAQTADNTTKVRVWQGVGFCLN